MNLCQFCLGFVKKNKEPRRDHLNAYWMRLANFAENMCQFRPVHRGRRLRCCEWSVCPFRGIPPADPGLETPRSSMSFRLPTSSSDATCV